MAVTSLISGHTYRLDFSAFWGMSSPATSRIGYKSIISTDLPISNWTSGNGPSYHASYSIAWGYNSATYNNIAINTPDMSTSHYLLASNSAKGKSVTFVYENTVNNLNVAAMYPYLTDITPKNIVLKDDTIRLYPKTSANLIDGLKEYVSEAMVAEKYVDVIFDACDDYVEIDCEYENYSSYKFAVDVTAQGSVTDSFWNTYYINDHETLEPGDCDGLTYLVVDGETINGYDITVSVTNKITGFTKTYHYEY